MKVSNLRFAALLCHYSDQGKWLLLCGQTFSMLEHTSSADSPKTNNWCCFCVQVSFIVIHHLPSSALLAPLVGHGACNRRSTANKIQNSDFLLPLHRNQSPSSSNSKDQLCEASGISWVRARLCMLTTQAWSSTLPYNLIFALKMSFASSLVISQLLWKFEGGTPNGLVEPIYYRNYHI